MKNRSVLLALCAALLACVLCAGCAKADTADYSAAKNGTVVVYEYVALEGQPVIAARGSGFFVGKTGEDPQYLITNHHVVEHYLNYGAGELGTVSVEGTAMQVKSYVRVYFDSEDYVEAYVVDYNEAQDIALLRLDQPTDQRQALKLCVPTDDDIGKTVYAVGFPSLSDNGIIDPATTWGLSDITITRGSISRLTTSSGSGVRRIQTDTVIQHGNSGGPLVNENGSVVGVNAMGVTNTASGESTNYAVNIDHVITMLNIHGVAYELESSSQPFPVVWVVVAVAVAVAAAAAAVVLRKKKAKPAEPQPVPQPEPAPVPAPAEPAAPAQPVNPNDSGYRLQGVAGALEGRRFMIRKEGKLVLGRNPQVCSIVFPADTAGVSGEHCAVWFDEGSVYIRDSGSRHGTFLSPGRKLTSGQPIRLQPGDQISLGSEAQTLVLVQKGGV